MNSSDKKILFSVIKPTYNRYKWLKFAIDSVLEQTEFSYEIIVVDDGSTDKTQELVKSYKNVSYVYQDQKGVSSARNTGSRLAKGSHLAFLDSDDQWHINKLEEQKKFLLKTPSLECVYSDEVWVLNGNRRNPHKKYAKKGGWIYLECLPLCRIPPSSFVISRTLFFNLGGFDEELFLAEDYDLWLRLASRVEIGYIDQQLIDKYGGHEDQLSKNWGMDECRVIALEKIIKLGDLNDEYLKATLDDLLKRLNILIKGFSKHGKEEKAKAFKVKHDYWINKQNSLLVN